MIMGLHKRMCQLMLLLLLVLVSREGLVRKVEAAGRKLRLCESQSHLFMGQCWSSKNCAHICRHERFHGGHCRGFRRRCFCTKPCPADAP